MCRRCDIIDSVKNKAITVAFVSKQFDLKSAAFTDQFGMNWKAQLDLKVQAKLEKNRSIKSGNCLKGNGTFNRTGDERLLPAKIAVS